jgi:hypothetical protein
MTSLDTNSGTYVRCRGEGVDSWRSDVARELKGKQQNTTQGKYKIKYLVGFLAEYSYSDQNLFQPNVVQKWLRYQNCKTKH